MLRKLWDNWLDVQSNLGKLGAYRSMLRVSQRELALAFLIAKLLRKLAGRRDVPGILTDGL